MLKLSIRWHIGNTKMQNLKLLTMKMDGNKANNCLKKLSLKLQ